MSQKSIQFHADPIELNSILRDTLAGGDLLLVAVTIHPFSATQVTSDSLEKVIVSGVVDRWYFCVDRPELSGGSGAVLAELALNSARLDIGRLTSRGLEQSWLVREDNQEPDSVKINRIFARIQRLTGAGVRAINPRTGAEAKVRNFRFSSGAKKLETAGVPILAPAGDAIIKLGI